MSAKSNGSRVVSFFSCPPTSTSGHEKLGYGVSNGRADIIQIPKPIRACVRVQPGRSNPARPLAAVHPSPHRPTAPPPRDGIAGIEPARMERRMRSDTRRVARRRHHPTDLHSFIQHIIPHTFHTGLSTTPTGPTKTMMLRASALLLALAAAIGTNAFIVSAPVPAHRQRAAPLQMGLFDAFKKGFENEQLDTPAPNAGLKNVGVDGMRWPMCIGDWGNGVGSDRGGDVHAMLYMRWRPPGGSTHAPRTLVDCSTTISPSTHPPIHPIQPPTQAPTMVKITFQPAGKVVEAVVGQNLKDVAAAAKVPVKYNCKKVRACGSGIPVWSDPGLTGRRFW